MKTRKNNWIVKITYITEEYLYVVKHITLLESTREEALRYARSVRSFDGCSSVCIYKLDAVL